MGIVPLTILYYQTAFGQCPFLEWFDSLDGGVRPIVDARLARLRHGLLGDAQTVGGGVFELRFHIGSGHRIYFGRDGKTFVVLLRAGSKKGQSDDIRTAKNYWDDYLKRTVKK